MRDIGLEEECRKAGLGQEFMTHCHWCENMAGEEYARAPSWGNGSAAQVRFAIPQENCAEIMALWPAH